MEAANLGTKVAATCSAYVAAAAAEVLGVWHHNILFLLTSSTWFE